MKFYKLLLICIATASVNVYAKDIPSVTYDWKVARVLDGDTIAFSAPFLPAPLKPELKVRVFGVDTPEKGFRAKCESEAKRGEAATEFTKNAVKNAKKHQISIMDWDKFGGRVLGDVLLDGVSLRNQLIKNGFAREYYGDAKQSWCN